MKLHRMLTWHRGLMLVVLILSMTATLLPTGPAYAQKKPQLDAPFVPTPEIVVEEMLKLANIKPGDVVFDLGCGDGRFLVSAAKKYGVKTYGCDLDPDRVKESLENAKKAGVEKLVTIEEKDIYKVDLTGASVMTLYLLPDQLRKLKPNFDKMKPGSRILCHDFEIPDVQSDKQVSVNNPAGREHTIYIYTTPLKVRKDE
jgi:cyclopropane fatty-acyl-phospholipid synthase-like methyltransferase